MSAGELARCLNQINDTDTSWQFGKGMPSPIKTIRGMKDNFFGEASEGNSGVDEKRDAEDSPVLDNSEGEVDAEDEELDESDR